MQVGCPQIANPRMPPQNREPQNAAPECVSFSRKGNPRITPECPAKKGAFWGSPHKKTSGPRMGPQNGNNLTAMKREPKFWGANFDPRMHFQFWGHYGESRVQCAYVSSLVRASRADSHVEFYAKWIPK